MNTPPITPTSTSAYGPSASAGGKSNASNGMGKNAFLQLLVTQLSNQDPLSPTDPTQFISQLAQFSSLEQLSNVNNGINVLALGQTAATSAQMVSYIGKKATYNDNTFVIGRPQDGKPPAADLRFRLDGNAQKVNVEIKDANGKVVRTIVLGQEGAGAHQIPFDGRDANGNVLAPGSYTFDVKASDAQGQTITASTHAEGLVAGVTYENGYPELLMGDGSKVALGQVVDIVAADTAPTSTASGSGAVPDHPSGS